MNDDISTEEALTMIERLEKIIAKLEESNEYLNNLKMKKKMK
jgi:hypothetical protein